jgi:hypothetical protein
MANFCQQSRICGPNAAAILLRYASSASLLEEYYYTTLSLSLEYPEK